MKPGFISTTFSTTTDKHTSKNSPAGQPKETVKPDNSIAHIASSLKQRKKDKMLNFNMPLPSNL